jgi:solute carrier family 35, member F5
LPELSRLPRAFTAESDAVTASVPIAANTTLLPPLSMRETAIEAMKFCFLWFLANYFSNAALQFTNVPSFTIISSMSGFFTLFIGVSVGVEKFTWVKLGALVISSTPSFQVADGSISGVTIVSLQDSESASAATDKGKLLLFGDAIALLGAAFYGCYTTLLKLRIQHESRVDMTLFFGFVGLYCLIFLWPFIIILSVLGVEPFELPPSTAVTLLIIVRSLL